MVKCCVSLGKVKVVKEVAISKKLKDGSKLTMPGDKDKPAVVIKWGDEVTECVWMPPTLLQRDLARGEFLSGLTFTNRTYLNLKGISSEGETVAQIYWAEVELDGKPYCAIRYINHKSTHVIIEQEIKTNGVVFDSFYIPVEMTVAGREIIVIPEQLFRKQRLDFEPVFKAEKIQAVELAEEPYKKAPALNLARDLNKMKKAIRKSPVESVYHITHFDNLSSILEYGLLSHNLAHKNGLLSKDISLSEVNELRNRIEPIFKRNLHDYVPLYFNPRNPMLFLRELSEKNLVILELSNLLLVMEGTIFTAGNAASLHTKFKHSVEEFKNLPFDIILGSHSWNNIPGGKRTMCAEVLVQERIDLPHIKAVLCKSEALTEKVDRLVGNHSPIEVKTDASRFF